MTRIEFIDLFSGAGGASLGFINQKFKPIFAADIDNWANETYRRNIRFEPQRVDLFKLDPKKKARELGDVDVMIGCPPCQGFSPLRSGKGANDIRNTLVFKYLEWIKVIKPKIVVFENVRGILFKKNKPYFDIFIKKLKKEGYKLVWGVLNAADFGVPQIRLRVIVIASKNSEPLLPKPTHANPDNKIALEEGLKPWRTVRDAISDLPPLNDGEENKKYPNHLTKKLPKRWKKLIEMIPKDGGDRRQVDKKYWLPCHRRHKGHWDVFGRLYWDRPSVTITTGCWDPSKGRFVHPEQNRGLSLRECARLQGFPDTFVFLGPPTVISRQIGNALPPPLSEAIARVVRGLL